MTTRAPTSELQETWRELMASHARVSEALERALQEKHDLSVSEFEVLQRLVESPEGHRRMQELADEIHLSQSALSRLVGRLEEAGLATRAICDHDRRGIWAKVMPAGRAAHKRAEPTYREVLEATLR
jgi:DNA-binding MarR family transcriptional regulator